MTLSVICRQRRRLNETVRNYLVWTYKTWFVQSSRFWHADTFITTVFSIISSDSSQLLNTVLKICILNLQSQIRNGGAVLNCQSTLFLVSDSQKELQYFIRAMIHPACYGPYAQGPFFWGYALYPNTKVAQHDECLYCFHHSHNSII